MLAALPDPLERAFCLTLFHTGCRISEALNLTAGSLDVTERALIFETLKRRGRGHYRVIPIPGSLCRLLREVVKAADSHERIWRFSRSTGYRLVKKCMTDAGISGSMSSPKGLRHGMAVACLTAQIPLPTVQKWMGHARLETTAIYLDVSGEEERSLAERLWVRNEG